MMIDLMSDDDQYVFMAGIVEGLAYARFRSDNKSTDGMACIYDWFYGDVRSSLTILDAFAAFPDRMPGAIIGALTKRECGE